MVGLRTQENMKFLAFFKLVQEAASELNSVFFLDSGEGNLFKDDNIECEDLSGWLIEKKMRMNSGYTLMQMKTYLKSGTAAVPLSAGKISMGR